MVSVPARQSLQQVALAYHRYGFNIIPMISGTKQAAIEWKQYQSTSQTQEDIERLKWTGNIAGVNGPNGIHSFDLDHCESVVYVYALLQGLGLPADYPWVVRSGNGYHMWFQCHEHHNLPGNKSVYVGLPTNTDAFKQLELRWSDCLTILPPSIHPDSGKNYKWTHGENIPETPLATLSAIRVVDAFRSLATISLKETRNVQEVTQVVQNHTPKGTSKRYDAWATKALNQELEIVRTTTEGGRNHQLNRSAYALGQIIGADLLDENQVIDALTIAAQNCGLSDREIEPTIKSGIEAGKKYPRQPKVIYQEHEIKDLPDIGEVDTTPLLQFSADDQGNAEAVQYLYGKYIAYNTAFGWMYWNKTHYVPGDGRVTQMIVETLRKRHRLALTNEVEAIAKVSAANNGRIKAARELLQTLCEVPVEEFDSYPDLINTQTGVVDLRTSRILAHDPALRFTWCTAVGYKPTADETAWFDFLKVTLPSQEMIDYSQVAMGYSITGHTSEECLFYQFGPPRAGKGTFDETIMGIFPRPIAVEVDFNTFTAKREGSDQNFDLAPLKPSRLVFASESNKGQSLNPGKVKALTGGNYVYCAFKHKDMFGYKPQYSVWLSSNHEVNGDPDDDALWGRVKVIEFPYSRLGEEDKGLKARLLKPENLEGVLRWLVEGAKKWYELEEKGLTTPQTVKDAGKKHRERLDSVGLWIEECCEIDPTSWVENSRVMTSYTEWCQTNGYEPKKAKGLSQSLEVHGIKVGIKQRVQVSQESKVVRGVEGIRLL